MLKSAFLGQKQHKNAQFLIINVIYLNIFKISSVVDWKQPELNR